MAYKWLAALALTGFAALAGRTFGGRSLRAAEEIRRLMDEMQVLRVLTLERLLPVSAALSELKMPVLRRAGEKMRADGALLPETAWMQAVSEERQAGGSAEALGAEEIGEVTALFEALRALNRREHEARYGQAIARLGRYEEEKRAAGREKVRLCTSLGALMGLAVAIIYV